MAKAATAKKKAPAKKAAASTTTGTGTSVATVPELRIPLPEHIARDYAMTESRWRTLIDAIYPSAQSPDAISLALDYCRAKGVDIMMRPIHIVPVWNSQLRKMVETVWPGIGLYRITAHRSVDYAGCDPCDFGPDVTTTFTGEVKEYNADGSVKGKKKVTKTVTHPAWARMTVYRNVNGERVAFHGPRVMWLAYYGKQGKTDLPNDRWERDPYGMGEKCAEAAALRRGFPEAVPGDEAFEEREAEMRDVTPPRDAAGAGDAMVDDIDDAGDTATTRRERQSDDTFVIVDALGEAHHVAASDFHNTFVKKVNAGGPENYRHMALVIDNTRRENADAKGHLPPVVKSDIDGATRFVEDKTGKRIADLLKPETNDDSSDAGADVDATTRSDRESPDTGAIPFTKDTPTMGDIGTWCETAVYVLKTISDPGDFKAWLANNRAAMDRIREATPDRLAAVDDQLARFD